MPLLFESNFDQHFACSVCVYCSEETRLQRAKKRGLGDINLYNKIKAAQLPQEEKKKRADFIINSDNSQEEIEKSLKDIIREVE